MKKHVEIKYQNKILRGYLDYVNDDKCAIVVHGIGGNKLGHKYIFRNLADASNASGLSTLRIDLLGSGESDGNFYETKHTEHINSLKTIIKYAKEVYNFKEICVIGTSIGSYVITQAVKNDKDIKSIVLWNPQFNMKRFKEGTKLNDEGIIDMNGLYLNEDYYKDLDKLVEDYELVTKNVLVIQGNLDIDADYDDAKKLSQKNNWNYIDLDNANHLFENTEARKKLYKETISFLLNN